MTKEKKSRFAMVALGILALMALSLGLKAGLEAGAARISQDVKAARQQATPLAESGADPEAHPFDAEAIDPGELPAESSPEQFRSAVGSWASASKIPALENVQGGLVQTGDEAAGQWSWFYTASDSEGNPVAFEVIWSADTGYQVSVKY